MILLVAALLSFAAWLVVLRLYPASKLLPPPAPHRSTLPWIAATIGVLVAQYPVLLAARSLLSAYPPLAADSSTHAAVSLAIAQHGLPHGWIDTYNGGLPFGIQYPWPPWLVPAGLIWLGMRAAHANHIVGLTALLALPVSVLWSARALAATPSAGLAAALTMAWLAPWSPFVGGWEAQLLMGLLTQTIALPLVPLWAASLFGNLRPVWAPILGAALVTAHPQIAVNAFLVVAPAALFARSGIDGASPRQRYLRSAVAAAALGLAMYGYGAMTLKVPLGWRPKHRAQQLGVGLRMLEPWFANYELLDVGRTPVLTVAWIAGLVSMLVGIEWSACKVVLASTFAAFAVAAFGSKLDALPGSTGRLAASLLQPLRVLPLLPLVAAAGIGTGLDRVIAAARVILRDGRWWRLSASFTAVVLVGISWQLALRPRAEWLARMTDTFDRLGPAAVCGEGTPAGFDIERLSGWLRALDRGRFAFDAKPMKHCPRTRGVELASNVPLGASYGAASHVFVNAAALYQIRPDELGSAARAEALGVRTFLHTRDRTPVDGGWRVRESSGDVVLSERVGGTDIVGVGCVTEVWRGEDEALYHALVDGFEADAALLSHPQELVRIETRPGPLEREIVDVGTCRTQGAAVTETRREPGAYEAKVVAPSDVEVVVRATAFPTWTIRVDGVAAAIERVAPGWMAVRVGPGQHAIEAVAAWPPYYGVGLLAALVIVVAAALLGRE